MSRKDNQREDHGWSVDEEPIGEMTLAEKVRDLHDTTREVVQFAFYLLFTITTFSVVVVGVVKLRLLVG